MWSKNHTVSLPLAIYTAPAHYHQEVIFRKEPNRLVSFVDKKPLWRSSEKLGLQMDWSETRSMEMGCWRDVGGTSVLKRGSEWYQFCRMWFEKLLLENGIFSGLEEKDELWVEPKPWGGSFYTEKRKALWQNPEDLVSNLGPHLLLSKSSSSGT